MNALREHIINTDGSLAALREYERQQDFDDAIMVQIEERTEELIEIHTADPADMILELVEENPERAQEVIGAMMSTVMKIEDIAPHRDWFFQEWIPERCELIAKEEHENE